MALVVDDEPDVAAAHHADEPLFMETANRAHDDLGVIGSALGALLDRDDRLIVKRALDLLLRLGEQLFPMREHEHLRKIPVIVVTGKVLTEENMARLNRGVTAVLEKGLFSLDETAEHITTAS